MPNTYDDAKFGVIERTWFGLPRKYGGECASGFTIASGTTESVVARWYPKGPIAVKKMGAFVCATLASADNGTGSVKRQRIPVEFYKSNSSGTARSTMLGSTHVICGAGGRTARFGIASDITPSSAEIEAGRFVTIFLATPNSDDGTVAAAVGTILGGGTLSFFIDWVRKYDTSTKWQV